MTHALMDVTAPLDGELSFDYGDRAKEDMEDLEEQTGRLADLKGRVQRLAAETTLEIGGILAEAQTRFSHRGNGTFIKWCKERCGIRKSTAYRCLRTHEAFGDCSNLEQSFDMSALYILSDRGCPEQARDEAKQAARDGTYINPTKTLEIQNRHQGLPGDCINANASPLTRARKHQAMPHSKRAPALYSAGHGRQVIKPRASSRQRTGMKDRIMTARALDVQRGRRRGKWFIRGLPGPDCKWCGPYDTKNEALDDARGLRRFYEELEQNLERARSGVADEPDKPDPAG